ncbi:M1 family aminopeptidase [Candidatus Bipolaricaulota bacterium]
MRMLLALCLLLILAAPSAFADANESDSPFAKEPAYSLDVRYNAESRTIEGSFDLEFVPESTTAYFSLLANLNSEPNPYLTPRLQDTTYPVGFEPARISILSVEQLTDDGEEAVSFRMLAMPPSWQTYSLDETVLAVDLPTTPAESAVTIRCRFVTEAPRASMGDQGVTDGIFTWRFGWFPMLFPEQSRIEEHDGVIAYAGVDSLPLVFPWVRLSATVIVPADTQLIVGTDIVEELTNAGGNSPISVDSADPEAATRSYLIRNETPSRSLALTIGSEYESYRIESSTDIEVYYLPHHESDARFIATLALDILADYIARYGPYPRSSLTIVENPSSHGQAFAADGIVWLSSRFFTHRDVLFPGALNRLIEYVLAHEIAHQWVGLGTGIDLDAEAWLSEGLAQYLSVRYFESRYGSFEPNLFAPQVPGIVGDFVKQQWGFFNLREHFVELPYLLTTRAGFDEELIKPTENVQFGNAKSVRLYDKGYLVARAIGAKIGFEAFERALTRAITERRADLLDARSFQLLLEEESDQSLAEFFEFWVFGPDSADYAIRILERSVEDGIHTTLVSVSRDGGVAQPVLIEATMNSEGTVRQEWNGIDDTAVLEFTTPTWVASVTIDPDHYLPDRDRLNNHAPVKIVGAVNKNVLPLDAYVLAPDQSTGGVIFSHLDRLRISVSQVSASASIKLNRSHRLSIETSFATPQFPGQLAYTYTAYGQPDTGSAATYWEPAFAFTITGERFVADGKPIMALKLRATDLRSVVDSGMQSVMFRIAPHGVVQAELSAQRELRLFPGVYLLGSARIGISNGDVPQPLRFRASEIHSVVLPRSNHAAAVKIALELPSPGSLPYSLFHLAMVDRIRGRLFLAAGAGWTSPDEFSTTSPSIEAGMEQIIELSTLGGLISMNARIGIAAPIIGRGATTLYGNISF